MDLNLVAASPAQIDERLAALWAELYPLMDQRDGHAGQLTAERQQEVLARIEQLRQLIKPLEGEWMRRGNWSRYYRVARDDGHVHSSRACSTCGPRTQFLWLIELAGQSEQEMIAALGREAWRLCTVCFPNAPVLPRPVDDGKCDGSPAPGQGTRLYKKCGKCDHVGSSRNWRRHTAK